MKFIYSISTMRHIAFVVLLMWLFALASGVANACLLEGRGTHGHDTTVGTSETATTTVVSAGRVGAVADHHEDSNASKAPCLKVCDDGSKSPIKQQLAFDLSDVGLTLLVRVLWTAAVPVVSVPRRMDDLQPSSPGLPIRVSYSRLAL